MVNYYDKNRYITKSTLARLADVSTRTFRRYLATRRPVLDAMGISPNARKLPPQAVRYICEDYCIDLPPELQDQEALNASPLRDIILRSWKQEHKIFFAKTVPRRTTASQDVVTLHQETKRYDLS